MLLDLRVQGMTAPSGMRRLMLYQLQEEMLNKDKEPKKDEPVVVVKQQAKPKVTRPTKHVTKVEAVEKPTRVVLPFKREPVKVEPTVYDALAELPALPVYVATYFSMSVVQSGLIINLATERRKRRKKKAVALLLMAA